MDARLTIGEVARRTGLPVRTIRFYEASGIVPHAARSAAGYGLYAHADVRRLRLAAQARALGLPLPAVKTLVGLAFRSECGAYLDDLLERVSAQRERAEQQVRALQERCASLGAIERHVRHLRDGVPAGRQVAECECCPLIDEGVPE